MKKKELFVRWIIVSEVTCDICHSKITDGFCFESADKKFYCQECELKNRIHGKISILTNAQYSKVYKYKKMCQSCGKRMEDTNSNYVYKIYNHHHQKIPVLSYFICSNCIDKYILQPIKFDQYYKSFLCTTIKYSVHRINKLIKRNGGVFTYK